MSEPFDIRARRRDAAQPREHADGAEEAAAERRRHVDMVLLARDAERRSRPAVEMEVEAEQPDSDPVLTAIRDIDAAALARNTPRGPARVLLRTVRQWSWPVAGFALAGLAIGAVIAMSTPQTYVSYAQVLLDPGDLAPVAGRSGDSVARQTARAVAESQVALVASAAVLDKVAERARLDQDPEFSGEGGVSSGPRALANMLLPFAEDPLAGRDRSVVTALRDRLAVDRPDDNFLVNVGVMTTNAEKSALVANEIAKAFVEELDALDTRSEKSGLDGARLLTPAMASGAPSNAPRAVVVAAYGATGLLIGVALTVFAAIRALAAEMTVPAGRIGESGLRLSDSMVAEPAPARAPKAVVATETLTPTDILEPHETESEMYPYPPYYPYPQQPQEQTAQHPAHQQWPSMPQPMGAWPAPQPWPSYPYPHAAAFAPYPPEQAYGWPTPPMPQPFMQQPMLQPMPHPMAGGYREPDRAQAPAPSPRDDQEFEDLRESVRALRETIEALMQRRDQRTRRAG